MTIKKCEVCGTSYKSANGSQKTCSGPCSRTLLKKRTAAYRAEKRKPKEKRNASIVINFFYLSEMTKGFATQVARTDLGIERNF